FAIHYFLALLKVADNILCKILYAALIADNGFELCPLRFGLLLFCNFFVLLQLGIKFFNKSFAFFIEVDFGKAAFIIDRHGSAIGNGLRYVVHIHILPEYLRGIYVCTL